MADPGNLYSMVFELKVQNDTARAYGKKLTSLKVEKEKVLLQVPIVENEIRETSLSIQQTENARNQTRAVIQQALQNGLNIASLRDTRVLIDVHKLGFRVFPLHYVRSITEADAMHLRRQHKTTIPFDDWRPKFGDLSEDDLDKKMESIESQLKYLEGQPLLAPHRGVVARASIGLLAKRRKRDAIKRREEPERRTKHKFDHWQATSQLWTKL